jgi:hypothetical protein
MARSHEIERDLIMKAAQHTPTTVPKYKFVLILPTAVITVGIHILFSHSMVLEEIVQQ